ncbi:hypothetical protein PQR39_35455 [Paraburkholderia sediminicola]|uniref:hypothetical protein n=1 Tax=Paraburkholderia sediminicola TaxID=458836 RepID=UPI0038BA1AC4
MSIVSGFIDLFRPASPEREKEKHLRLARLQLAECEICVEDYQATVTKLKSRIARLEADLQGDAADSRPARSSIQAPHPGQAMRSNVGAFSVPDAKLRGA